ncbi:MAG: leucine-rich repeat domain-containing protein [Paludibacter sp.]|nr:leucine-rich repeat domain-containing protein [Paludibacter sp.]
MIFDKLNMKDTIGRMTVFNNPQAGNDDPTHQEAYENKIVWEIKNDYSGFETVLFNKELTSLIHCPVTARGSYVIPDSVEAIGIEAFAKCKGVISVRLPLSLKVIGCLAFDSCINLATITIPESVLELGYRTFSNCTGLKSIYVHAKVSLKLDADCDLFYHVDTDNCILYIPQGTKNEYLHATQWREFKNIVEMMPVQELAILN